MQKEQTEIFLDHILLRPDNYIGTLEPIKQHKWILSKGHSIFTCKEITYTPGFYNVFEELLVDAAHNYKLNNNTNQFNVEINQEQGYIRVINQGLGIPGQIYQKQILCLFELMSGHLLTQSNENDQKKIIVGERNFSSAKLANLFSDMFIVEWGDFQNKKRLQIVWKNNMKIHEKGQITAYDGKDFLSVTYYPCFKLFNMKNGLDEDIFALMSKRVYDIAGIFPSVKVTLNKQQIDIKSFLDYVEMYCNKDSFRQKIFDSKVNNDSWEVIVTNGDGQFKQFSFVNGVCTQKGGTHVDYLVDQIVEKVTIKIKRKDKEVEVNSSDIKAHIWIFVKCLIENPIFDTQKKEKLTLKPADFGSKCKLSDQMIKDIMKLGLVDAVIQIAKAKAMNKFANPGNLGISKLLDANEAGTRNSHKCTLILTDGESAKNFALNGLSVIGRDYFGVFPLKGKLLNVREANIKQVRTNVPILQLVNALGLIFGNTYNDLESLRYHSILILTNQDQDGFWFVAGIINLFAVFWPEILRFRKFLRLCLSPLVVVSKGMEKISFYTMNDYKKWIQSVEESLSWTIKHFRGLGTLNQQEICQYFSEFGNHVIDFQYVDNQDDDAIQVIFSKKRIQDRKRWLISDHPSSVNYSKVKSIRIKDFIDQNLKEYSILDGKRHIGSLIDGFKVGQRKIMYGCFKRRLNKQVKVQQLAGYIVQNSAYHQGETSLYQMMIAMAQDFVGSNNINLLIPAAQFGSRLNGGKDHAMAVYLYIVLSIIARKIFCQPDDHVLNYFQEYSQIIEPEFYVPIIPMVLINGCQGFGTAWRTYIPKFNPREICEIIKRKLKGEDFPVIHPWYKNYTGNIIPKEGLQSYTVRGHCYIDLCKKNTVVIDQLPLATWTNDFKSRINDIMNKGQQQIVFFRDKGTKDTINFQIEFNQKFFKKLYQPNSMDKFIKYFKLQTSFSMKNLVGFNQQMKIVRMPNINSILQDFYRIRITFYQKRKEYLQSKLIKQISQLLQKTRFVDEVINDQIPIEKLNKLKIEQICKELEERKYLKYSELPQVKSTIDHSPIDKEYGYLLNIPIFSFRQEKVEQLNKRRNKKQMELEKLKNTRIEDMWIQDLDILLTQLDKIEALEKAEKQMQKQNRHLLPQIPMISLHKRPVLKVQSQSPMKLCKRLNSEIDMFKEVKKQQNEDERKNWDSENNPEKTIDGNLKKCFNNINRQYDWDSEDFTEQKTFGNINLPSENLNKDKDIIKDTPQRSFNANPISGVKKQQREASSYFLRSRTVQKKVAFEEIPSKSKNFKLCENNLISLDYDEDEEIEYHKYEQSR